MPRHHLDLGPLLVRNLVVYQQLHWLRELAGKLPTLAPNESGAMHSPANFNHARQQAEVMFHACRCKTYRDTCPPARQAVLREKHIASQLFKGKKLSYPASVAQPFVGDHVGLQSPEIAGTEGVLVCSVCVSVGVRVVLACSDATHTCDFTQSMSPCRC